MRMGAAKDMFLNYYDVDINTMTIYASFIASPGLFKMFTGFVVDARVVSKRKYYLIFFALICTLLQLIVSVQCMTEHFHIAIVLFLEMYAATFLDVTIESIVVQQARRDPLYG